MFWNNTSRHDNLPPRRVAGARRPLDRAYIALSFLFLFALVAVAFVTVIQASPSVTEYGVGWYSANAQVGTTFQQKGNDSPVRVFSGPDQIGFERQLYALINKARVDRGLTPLKLSDALTRSARGHSSDMAKSEKIEAVDSTGRTPAQRADDSGFRPPQFVVEALGAGYSSPDQVMSSWLANPNTLADLLNGDANEIGVGYAFARTDNAFHHYWTVDIGRLDGLVFTVVVNNGAESTTSAQVLLHIGGSGWAQAMMISNSPDYAGAAWEPFSDTKTWKLSDGTGPKTIYLKLRGPGDQIIETVGTVALDPAAKGVKPGAPYTDTFQAPRPPLMRVPAGEISLTGNNPLAPGQTVSFGPSSALSPGYYQTSEFMLGKVAVGIVTPQCTGTVDKCSETWTPKMMDQVVSQVTTGTNWWVKKMNGNVTFVYDQQRQAPTGYEPVNHSQSDEGLWIGDAMTHLGFTGSTYFEQVYAYNNWMRQKYGTDWAFTIFVANSEKNASGTFSNGYFAYSYVPGPFSVITYDNDGYTINNMAAVVAHETGHIFGALDQYSGAKVACTATSGYLVFQNQNSQQNCTSNVDSIMRGGLVPYSNNLIDNFALGMVGGRVSNNGNLPDPINTSPIVAINRLASTTKQSNPTITGTAQDQPYPSPSGNSVTINYITAVHYRVDGGSWQSASPSDGSAAFSRVSQGFTFSPSLSPGAHQIEVQATNRVNHSSGIANANILVQGNEPSSTPVVLQPNPTAIPAARASAPPAPSPTPGGRQETLVLAINAGNTAISLPYAGYTAASVLAAINSQGGSATEIDKWTGRNWQPYIHDAGSKDYAIDVGVGYMLKASHASTWKIGASPLPDAQPIKLDKGWNMLGVSACKDGSSSCFTASTIAAAVNAAGGGVAEIDRWSNGSWSAFQVGYPFNDFPITEGQGYFVRTSKASIWSP